MPLFFAAALSPYRQLLASDSLFFAFLDASKEVFFAFFEAAALDVPDTAFAAFLDVSRFMLFPVFFAIFKSSISCFFVPKKCTDINLLPS